VLRNIDPLQFALGAQSASQMPGNETQQLTGADTDKSCTCGQGLLGRVLAPEILTDPVCPERRTSGISARAAPRCGRCPASSTGLMVIGNLVIFVKNAQMRARRHGVDESFKILAWSHRALTRLKSEVFVMPSTSGLKGQASVSTSSRAGRECFSGKHVVSILSYFETGHNVTNLACWHCL
jgi:hypothetical protein